MVNLHPWYTYNSGVNVYLISPSVEGACQTHSRTPVSQFNGWWEHINGQSLSMVYINFYLASASVEGACHTHSRTPVPHFIACFDRLEKGQGYWHRLLIRSHEYEYDIFVRRKCIRCLSPVHAVFAVFTHLSYPILSRSIPRLQTKTRRLSNSYFSLLVIT